ncbi:MAG TPA: hypothetical protein PLR20_01500 [Syntrophales bacterium]|nr:hypothetical protein [Syntrophales bacterium]HOX93584.1 hypothetical protein [Syntrophales bacterium]HPI56879.1 hypothetical protein [Syntrophales bacterium]HPN23465.1 hypothetical protein [Syntrophales bacterium]HQM28010.1 hypothetical protein [Syntrophales bacterium]
MEKDKEQALTVKEEIFNIQPEDVSKVKSIGRGRVKWLKVTPEGFCDNSFNIMPRMFGRITEMRPYWIRWSDEDLPDTIPFTSPNDQPEGYELRTNVKVLLPDGDLVGLNLSKTSSFIFSDYVNALEKINLSVEDVVTEFTTKMITPKKGQKYAAAEFRYILPKGEPKKKEETPVEVSISDIYDDVPF